MSFNQNLLCLIGIKTLDARIHCIKFRSALFCIMYALTSTSILRGVSHNSCLWNCQSKTGFVRLGL